ncbi:hypothetical protein [Labilithrix luteola]|nr:hypothetical protein [Labilithrix luteola]
MSAVEPDRLGEATDALTDSLHAAEAFLRSRNKGVSAQVTMGDLTLSWIRHGDGWRIVIGAKEFERANRAGRILAGIHLGALLEKIEANERTLAEDLSTALECAKAFVQAHPAPVVAVSASEDRRCWRARPSIGGGWCYDRSLTSLSATIDDGASPGGSYVIECVELTDEELEKLGDFDGW